VRFLWAKNMDAAKDIHKEMLPIYGPCWAELQLLVITGTVLGRTAAARGASLWMCSDVCKGTEYDGCSVNMSNMRAAGFKVHKDAKKTRFVQVTKTAWICQIPKQVQSQV
jgi:hypothetical protein